MGPQRIVEALAGAQHGLRRVALELVQREKARDGFWLDHEDPIELIARGLNHAFDAQHVRDVLGVVPVVQLIVCSLVAAALHALEENVLVLP